MAQDRERIAALQQRAFDFTCGVVDARCQLAGWREVEKFEDEARQLSLIFGKIIVNKKAGMNRARP